MLQSLRAVFSFRRPARHQPSPDEQKSKAVAEGVTSPPPAVEPAASVASEPKVAVGPSPKATAATTTQRPAEGSLSPADKTPNEEALRALDTDVSTLLNMTASTLCRALRPPARGTIKQSRGLSGSKGEDSSNRSSSNSVSSAFGPFPMGQELATSIEQRARGLFLEPSLKPEQNSRLLRTTQSAQDLSTALRASRYAWQTCLLLASEVEGMGAFARLKRITESVVELNSRVAQAMEQGEDAGSAVAAQYRTCLTTASEVEAFLRSGALNEELSPTARRLTRASLYSLSITAECMAKVGARYALPIEETRLAPRKPEILRDYDPLLAPVPKR